MPCYTCFATGSVSCPTCQGKGGDYNKVDDIDTWEPCYQCGGKRTVSCQTCGARGVLPEVTP